MSSLFRAILCFSISANLINAIPVETMFQAPIQPEWSLNETAIPVACVGDSITAGYLSTGGLNYPNQLQKILGSGYKVMNFGEGGRTMLKKGDNPYWRCLTF